MIVDEGLALLLGEGVEGVELASKVALVVVEGLSDTGHDLNALLVGDAGAEGVVGEVAAHADAGGDDHGSLIIREVGAVELAGVHVADVLVVLAVLVVALDDVVEKVGEVGVGAVGASVAADTGVNVLAAGEDALLEGHAGSVFLAVVLFPYILGQGLAEGARLVLSGEGGVTLQVIDVLEPGTAVGHALLCRRLGELKRVSVFGSSATHE